ncbi:unnamed protein product [Dibothriocephalus latus]|uniref:Uncharacterized protein n=1 Tax=Dibothriocephalus latus TaxID=60516 RepID=A0A3P7P6A4_DIBLA|nr:unnamed protein product [Dibothriocephalus latus]
MIRVIVQDCHARLRKFRQRIKEEKAKCLECIGENTKQLLQQRVAKRAHEHKTKREAALAVKFRKLLHSMSFKDDKLVQNLSSKELTDEHMQVLRHEASFNTTDAGPANMVAAVESILSQTEAMDVAKNLIRHQVSSLLMAHRPRDALSKVERKAPKELRADNDLVIVPADKGWSTVIGQDRLQLQSSKSVRRSSVLRHMQIQPYKNADTRAQHKAVGDGELRWNIANRLAHGKSARTGPGPLLWSPEGALSRRIPPANCIAQRNSILRTGNVAVPTAQIPDHSFRHNSQVINAISGET